jgi:hypothetical protein
VKRETTQLEKTVLCLSQEMWEKGDNSIRENSCMFISRNMGLSPFSHISGDKHNTIFFN